MINPGAGHTKSSGQLQDLELKISRSIPVTEAICEALQEVSVLQVSEMSHGCHQRRPQHLLRPRARAVHAAQHHHHRRERVLVVDALQPGGHVSVGRPTRRAHSPQNLYAVTAVHCLAGVSLAESHTPALYQEL